MLILSKSCNSGTVSGNCGRFLTDGDTLGVNGTQIAVLQKVYNEVLCGLHSPVFIICKCTLALEVAFEDSFVC